jgi:ATP-dependent protease ClpP protease subunit
MYKIKLFGDFTYEILRGWLYGEDESIVTTDHLEQELKIANGEDLEVDLSSPGGYVDVATDMIIMLRDYKREFKGSQMQLNIKGVAASAASFFAAAEVWDLITVEDISTWMGHRPFVCICGDYEVFESEAESLKRATQLYASVYVKRSGKTNDEVLELMRKTTYLYGQEIVNNGFADEIMTTDNNMDKDVAIASMQKEHKEIMKRMRETEHENEKEYLEKLAASLTRYEARHNNIKQSVQPAGGGNNKMKEEGLTMANTLDELRNENPALYSETVQAGKTEMIANNKAIMEFRDKEEYKNLPFIHERCDKAIMEGESFEDLKMAVMALMLDPKNQASIESPGDINTGAGDTMSGEQGSKNKDEARW